MSKIFTVSFVVLALLFSNCKQDPRFSGTEIARVHDKYLLLSELQENFPQELKGKDSLLFVQNYINNWIANELIVSEAKVNLPEERQDFSKQLKSYENSLLIYNYEHSLINQKLDTLVTEQEIEEYYTGHKQHFPLTTSYVRLIYAKVEKGSDKYKKVRKYFYGKQFQGRYDSLTLCFENCTELAQTDTTLWIPEMEAKKLVPLKDLSKPGKYMVNNGNSVYFIEILEFRERGNITPLSLISSQIKQIILNKRKAKIVQDMRKHLLQKAENSGAITIY